MLDLLRQAADEGLISLKSDANTTPADTAAPVAAAEEADDSQIRIATIKPDETPPRPQTPPPATRGAAARACLDDDAFSLNADQFESDPLGAISEMQANLAHADTSTQRSIAEDLAAGFISIGFGEEALAVLAEHGADVSLHGEMARAVANLPLPPAGAILGAADCEGAHALWQALSEPADRATGPAARSRDAIDTLPTRLKRLAATRIARKMADAGAWKQTKRFFEIAKEGADPSSPDLAFIEAMLKENEGRASEAEDKLLEIAATNTQASQDALVALAERYVDGDRPHEGFLDDIGTVAKTQRGSETGAQAAILEGVAYADAGHIEAGVLLLRHAAESGAADAAIARSEARRIITRAAKETNEKVNLAALTAYLDNREFVDEPDSSPEFRTSLATTALKVGLANVAFKVIRNDPSSDATVAHMKARAAIEAKAPNEAIAAAAQHADKQAFAELVAEANLRLENYYAAIAAASVLPDGDRRAMLTAQAAWRAGDWETAARAFASLNPSLMGEALAVQYGLAAYMSGARELPNLSAAVLQSANSSSLPGLRQLFEDRPTGSVLARGKAVVRQSHDEIELIEKALDNG